jgi:hypothetical protein
MKEPCGPCPFSRSKTLGLHPRRAEDFALMAQNRYTDFPCHKTAECAEDRFGEEIGYVRTEKSFTCNGFLSLQVNECMIAPDGFEPHDDAFSDAWEMIEHHTELWLKQHPHWSDEDDDDEEEEAA